MNIVEVCARKKLLKDIDLVFDEDGFAILAVSKEAAAKLFTVVDERR